MKYEIELHTNLVQALETWASRRGTTAAVVVQLAISRFLVAVMEGEVTATGEERVKAEAGR